MQATIEQLRRICHRCLEDSDAQLRWLGGALNEFLSHRCRTVDEALGLRFARGGIPWWREEAARKRNAALRELARRYYGQEPVTAQARQVHIATLRYATSAWRHDQREQVMPPRYAGTDHEWLWAAFAAGAPMPIRERQLRHVLQGCGSSTDHANRNGVQTAVQYLK